MTAGSGALSAVPLQISWPLLSELSVQEIRTGVLCDEQESWPPDRSAALGYAVPRTTKSATHFPSLRDGAYGCAPLGTYAGRSAPRADLAAPPEEAVRPLTRGVPAPAHRAPAPNPRRSRLPRPRRPRHRPAPRAGLRALILRLVDGPARRAQHLTLRLRPGPRADGVRPPSLHMGHARQPFQSLDRNASRRRPALEGETLVIQLRRAPRVAERAPSAPMSRSP